MSEMSSTTSTSQDKGPVFPLLDLPPELWIRICKYAVIDDKVIEIAYPEDSKHVCTATQQPAITRVSKTIREEILPTFYWDNEFLIHDNNGSMDDFEGVEKWRVNIGSKYCCLLRGLYFTSEDRGCGNWLKDIIIGREYWIIFPKFDEIEEGSPRRLTMESLMQYTYKVVFAGDNVGLKKKAK